MRTKNRHLQVGMFPLVTALKRVEEGDIVVLLMHCQYKGEHLNLQVRNLARMEGIGSNFQNMGPCAGQHQ